MEIFDANLRRRWNNKMCTAKSNEEGLMKFSTQRISLHFVKKKLFFELKKNVSLFEKFIRILN